MKAVLYAVARHQSASMELLRDCLKVHGIETEIRAPSQYTPSDVAAVWGHRQHRIMQGQRERGLNYLVMERAYFKDRFKFYSLGWNGLNGHADFCTEKTNGARWAKHGWTLPAWKEEKPTDVVLIGGQVARDASLANCQNYPMWLVEQAKKARVYGLPVVYRPHPLGTPILHRELALRSRLTLEQDLARARVVITYNSNLGVDAVLAGVPSIVGDRGSMAWEVSGHEVGAPLYRPAREAWAARLAHCQWTADEIRAGEPWEQLKEKLC